MKKFILASFLSIFAVSVNAGTFLTQILIKIQPKLNL